MEKFIQKVHIATKIMHKVEYIYIIVLMLIMTALAFLQVLTRYVFSFSFFWLEELSRYLMIWLGFVGMGYVASQRDHVNIDLLPSWVKKKTNFDFMIVVNIVEIVFFVILLKYGITLCRNVGRWGQVAEMLRFPMKYVYSCVPIGAALSIFYNLVVILERIVEMKSAKGGSAECR